MGSARVGLASCRVRECGTVARCRGGYINMYMHMIYTSVAVTGLRAAPPRSALDPQTWLEAHQFRAISRHGRAHHAWRSGGGVRAHCGGGARGANRRYHPDYCVHRHRRRAVCSLVAAGAKAGEAEEAEAQEARDAAGPGGQGARGNSGAGVQRCGGRPRARATGRPRRVASAGGRRQGELPRGPHEQAAARRAGGLRSGVVGARLDVSAAGGAAEPAPAPAPALPAQGARERAAPE